MFKLFLLALFLCLIGIKPSQIYDKMFDAIADVLRKRLPLLTAISDQYYPGLRYVGST